MCVVRAGLWIATRKALQFSAISVGNVAELGGIGLYATPGRNDLKGRLKATALKST
jgi:hypothetical protein